MDPDLPLITALQAGTDTALDELIRRHQEPLLRFVYRYLHDETSARDVVQEVFVRVYFKAAKYRPEASVKTWIYAIAVNLCRDHVRRIARYRQHISTDAPAEGRDGPGELADSGPLPDEHARQSDRFQALQAAIDQLPRQLKEALVLFALDGRSQIEVAQILGTTPKAVELRVRHAKERLRVILGATLGPHQ